MIRPTTAHALANTIPGDPVRLSAGDCPKCGPDGPIRSFGYTRQCGGCGWVISPPRDE